MNIASIIPAHVAGFVLTVLLFVTLTALPRNMATAGPAHRKRHIAFLISCVPEDAPTEHIRDVLVQTFNGNCTFFV